MGIFGKSKQEKALDLIQCESQQLNRIKTQSDAEAMFFKMAKEVTDNFARNLLIYLKNSYFSRNAEQIGNAEAKAFVLCITKACAHYLIFFTETRNESLNAYITEINRAIQSQLSLTKENDELTRNMTFHCQQDWGEYSTFITFSLYKYVFHSVQDLTRGDNLAVASLFRTAIDSEIEKISEVQFKEKNDYYLKYEIAINDFGDVGCRIAANDSNISSREYIRLWSLHYFKMLYNLQDSDNNNQMNFFKDCIDLALSEPISGDSNFFDVLPIKITYTDFSNVRSPIIFSGSYRKDSAFRRILTSFPSDCDIKLSHIVVTNIALLQSAVNDCKDNLKQMEFLNKTSIFTRAAALDIDEIKVEEISLLERTVYELVCDEMGIIDSEKDFEDKLLKFAEVIDTAFRQ